jgi:hypothetical protein
MNPDCTEKLQTYLTRIIEISNIQAPCRAKFFTGFVENQSNGVSNSRSEQMMRTFDLLGVSATTTLFEVSQNLILLLFLPEIS